VRRGGLRVFLSALFVVEEEDEESPALLLMLCLPVLPPLLRLNWTVFDPGVLASFLS